MLKHRNCLIFCVAVLFFVLSVMPTLQTGEKPAKKSDNKTFLFVAGVGVSLISFWLYLLFKAKETKIKEIDEGGHNVEPNNLIYREAINELAVWKSGHVLHVNNDQKLKSYDLDLYDAATKKTFGQKLAILETDIDLLNAFSGEDNDLLKISEPFFQFAENVKFFYGKCDIYERHLGDFCAWRCIQMCLSHYNIFITLDSLHRRYRQKQNNMTEWAEPGYGRMIFRDIANLLRIDLKGETWLYNRYQGTERSTPIIDGIIEGGFRRLVDKLMDHFANNKTPVMIDDTVYAYVILGLREIRWLEEVKGKKKERSNIRFLIADPHKTSKESGIYYIEYNNKGEKRHNSCLHDEDGAYGITGSAKRIDLQRPQGWLLLFPQENALACKTLLSAPFAIDQTFNN